MDKTIILNRFNETADEFCKDLVSTFPEVKEFKQLKSGLLLLKNVNEKQPRELFHKFVAEHFHKEIVAKDDSFFLNELHNHELLKGETSQWQNVLTLLRALWTGLSEVNKNNIWKYFQVLLALNDRYIS